MWTSQNGLRGLISGALFVLGCSGLWDPFLSNRGQNPGGQPDGGSNTIDPANSVITGLCTPAGLCWQNPLPQGNRLAAVRAISSSDAWAVGAAGTILHWDGMTWSLVDSGTTSHLNDLWAYDAQNLWVVGHGSTILRWTPPSFTRDPVGGLGDLYAVRGLDPQKVFAAGTNNAAVKWNGAQWAQSGVGTSITYRGIWPEDFNQAWACTVGGAVWAWHMQPDLLERNGGNSDLLRMWGTSRYSLFAVGDAGNMVRRDGSGNWLPLLTGTSAKLGGMWGPDANEAWIVGSGGTILRWDGTKQVVSPEGGPIGVDLNDVSGVSRTDVWAVGEAGAILHRNAEGWRLLRTGPTNTIHAAWAASENDAWAVGSGGLLLRWDGNSWRSIQAPINGDWYAIAGSGANNVWVAGQQGNVMRWDGSTWSAQSIQTPTDLRGLYVPSMGTSVFAVGLQGLVFRYSGGWQVQNSNTLSALYGIWGSAADDIWAAGQAGVVIHWNGTAWTPVTSPTTQDLYAIGGSSISNLWFVGANATALFWDGVMLRSRNMGLAGTLRAVWSNGTSTMAAGDNGALYRFTGGMVDRWSAQASGTANALRALIQQPQTSPPAVWLLGDSGTILFYKG